MVVLNEDGELTKEWKETFKTYKRCSNYPTLQDVSNLIDHKVQSSQCGVILRGSYSAGYDISVEVIEVANFIGQIPDVWKKILYIRLGKKLAKNSRQTQKPSLKTFRKILEENG